MTFLLLSACGFQLFHRFASFTSKPLPDFQHSAHHSSVPVERAAVRRPAASSHGAELSSNRESAVSLALSIV